MVGDKGLVVKNPAAHHAISAKFSKKIDNKGKTLVVQYEVKLQSEPHTVNFLAALAYTSQMVSSVEAHT
jgi:Calreticulin family